MSTIINRDAIVYQLISVLVERKKQNLHPLPLEDAYKVLAKRFNLSEADLALTNPSDGSNKWQSEVRFACTELRKQNVIHKYPAKLEITEPSFHKMQNLLDIANRSDIK